MASKRFPILPLHPERVCWGCDRYCAADALICGNGTVRTPHPSELFGEDWASWGLDAAPRPAGEDGAQDNARSAPPST